MTGTTGSLEASDAAAASVQKTPHRVTLDQINANVAQVDYYNPPSCPQLTLAIVVHANGYVVVGQSAPADPGNFDAELGKKFAREDAIRKFWPLEGFALRYELSKAP